MELELFSSNYFPRAGAGAFRQIFFLPELELELLGSDFFQRAGAGPYKLQTFLPELELKLRVLDKNVGAKSGAAKFMFQINLKTQLKPYYSNTVLVIIPTSILKSNNTENLPVRKGFQNPYLSFLSFKNGQAYLKI